MSPHDVNKENEEKFLFLLIKNKWALTEMFSHLYQGHAKR